MLCFASVEVYQAFITTEGHKIYLRGVFYDTYQVSGETTSFKNLYSEISVYESHDIRK